MKAAIMGYGTIGSGVYEVLDRNCKIVEKKAGEPIEVKYILDLREFPGTPIEKLVIHDVKTIVDDPEIGIVVETMGGTTPAYEFVKSCLLAGKHVVTSNKALVAAHGTELIRIAAEKNVSFLFEASVGGGIPIIRPMHQCLTANNIIKIAGILNGTTNYILNQMIANGETFETALKEAQAKGYAEKNPAADVEGYDACRKIAILASLAWREEIDYNDIETIGITDITLEDIKYAGLADRVIKLIGYAEMLDNGKVYAAVSPMLVKKGGPLSNVNGVFNAIMVTGDCVGDVMFYGRGAGKLPTASAVVADIVDGVKHRERSKQIYWEKPAQSISASKDDKAFRYFVRCSDEKSKIAEIFGECEYIDGGIDGERAFITPELTGSEKEEKLSELANAISCIRVMD